MGQIRSLPFKAGQVVRVRIPPYAKSWKTETSTVRKVVDGIIFLDKPLNGSSYYEQKDMQHVRYNGKRKADFEKKSNAGTSEEMKIEPDSIIIDRSNWVAKIILLHERHALGEISAEIDELKAQDALNHKRGKCEICKRILIAEKYLAKETK